MDGAPRRARSRSRETTFQQDIGDWEDVRGEVARLAMLVAGDPVSEQRLVRRVVVKVRYVPFSTYEFGYTLEAPTCDAAAIEQGALAALDRSTKRRPVRLLGVRTEFAD